MDLADKLNSLKLDPSTDLTQRLDNVPRYLFRVYSPNSSGENSRTLMKSVDATNSCLTDIFSRDRKEVALALNEHLRWEPDKSRGDPFVSWTTSLVFAIQYILFKHKNRENLGSISLCVIDTTMFPRGTFIRDLDLIQEFQDSVPGSHPIRGRYKGNPWPTTWEIQGLENFGNLRRKQRTNYQGFYYFGEYLSQGDTCIQGRSCTVSSNRVITDELFVLQPRFKDNPGSNARSLWANAVISFREQFYRADQEAVDLTLQMVLAARAIAMEFTPQFCVPIWANLMALRPFRTEDAQIGRMIYARFPDQVMRMCAKRIRVVADHTIPEVQKFEKIISAVREAHYANTITTRTKALLAEMNSITRRLNEEMLVICDEGPIAAKVERIDTGYLEPLYNQIEGFRKELQNLSSALRDADEPGSLV